MALTPERVTEITKSIIKSAFFNYFLCREEVTTKHLVLSRFFPEESIIRSAIGGIETSLGSFWGKVARAIAIENGFQVLNPKVDLQEPKHIPTAISHLLDGHKYQREAALSQIGITKTVEPLLFITIPSILGQSPDKLSVVLNDSADKVRKRKYCRTQQTLRLETKNDCPSSHFEVLGGPGRNRPGPRMSNPISKSLIF